LGGSALWEAFMGMVLWIVIFVKGIDDMFAYVDNTFSWEFANTSEWYEPYHMMLPTPPLMG
jgi:hypothetical protein